LKVFESHQESSREKAILVGVEMPWSRQSVALEYGLEELARLTESAGAAVVERFAQRLREVTPATLIGQGKVVEIKAAVAARKANLVVFDVELTPAQQRNLESALDVRVVDRGQVILDIFAQRARSKEGKLQVELAQLAYLLPRLTRQWAHLSRLGGGIGTRGPGETQLEVDRRRVRERIGALRRRLAVVEQTRSLQRAARFKVPYPVVALVGYTNSGKSTLMNALTRAGVLVEDKLFATLDPTIRRLRLPTGDQAMLVDTVGFINKIPHSLVEAFKSTLEEVRSADLLLRVFDATHPLYEEHLRVVSSVLAEIGAAHTPYVLAPNKIDLVPAGPPRFAANGAREVCPISALTGAGVDDLLAVLARNLDYGKSPTRFVFAPSQGRLLDLVRRQGEILDERYENGKVHVTARVSEKLAGQLRKWLEEKTPC
jgi:GTP-binding protein HflX